MHLTILHCPSDDWRRNDERIFHFSRESASNASPMSWDGEYVNWSKVERAVRMDNGEGAVTVAEVAAIGGGTKAVAAGEVVGAVVLFGSKWPRQGWRQRWESCRRGCSRRVRRVSEQALTGWLPVARYWEGTGGCSWWHCEKRKKWKISGWPICGHDGPELFGCSFILLPNLFSLIGSIFIVTRYCHIIFLRLTYTDSVLKIKLSKVKHK